MNNESLAISPISVPGSQGYNMTSTVMPSVPQQSYLDSLAMNGFDPSNPGAYHQTNAAPTVTNQAKFMSNLHKPWEPEKTKFWGEGTSWTDRIGTVANLGGAALSLANMWQNLKQGKESFALNKENMRNQIDNSEEMYATHKQNVAGTSNAIKAANSAAKQTYGV